MDVSVFVQIVLASDRVELQESTQRRAVVPGAIVIEPGLRIEVWVRRALSYRCPKTLDATSACSASGP